MWGFPKMTFSNVMFYYNPKIFGLLFHYLISSSHSVISRHASSLTLKSGLYHPALKCNTDDVYGTENCIRYNEVECSSQNMN